MHMLMCNLQTKYRKFKVPQGRDICSAVSTTGKFACSEVLGDCQCLHSKPYDTAWSKFEEKEAILAVSSITPYPNR